MYVYIFNISYSSIYIGDEEIKHHPFRLRRVIKRSVASEIFAKGSRRQIMAMWILKYAKREGEREIRTGSRNNDTKIGRSLVMSTVITREAISENARH